jgi:pentatricopeptide repeat protein
MRYFYYVVLSSKLNPTFFHTPSTSPPSLLLSSLCSSYVLVAEAMALAGDLQGQRKLLARMDAERVVATPHFFACVMDAQGHQPEWVHAEMRERGVAQHTNTYEMQLRMLAEKNPERALQVYREMRSQRLFPSEVHSPLPSLSYCSKKKKKLTAAFFSPSSPSFSLPFPFSSQKCYAILNYLPPSISYENLGK